MGRYVGEIQIKEAGGSSFYVNFFPGYELVDDQFVYLLDEDIHQLLPDSGMPNLNLFSSNPAMRLEDLFIDGDDIVLDFTYDDLIPNYKGPDLRYPTAWKLDISRHSGAVMSRLDDYGWYYVIEKEAVPEDWQTSAVVELDSPNINEGMFILVPDDKDPEVLYGPFHVRYNEQMGHIYFNTHLARNKYVMRGYRYEGGVKRHARVLEQQDVTRAYIKIQGTGISAVHQDQITPELLLNDFKETLARRGYKQHKLDLASVPSMLEHYENSLLTGVAIPPEIAQNRAKMLRSIFDAEKNYDSMVQSVSSLAGSLVAGLNDENWRTFVTRLSKDEEFISSLSQFEQFSKRIESTRREIVSLEQTRDDLKKNVAELERLNPKEHIEQYNQEIERLEQARANAEVQLDEILQRQNLGKGVEELENRAQYLRSDISAKEARLNALNVQIDTLNSQIDDILSNSARRAMEISFDSLLSTRMMVQTAKLEREKELAHYADAARAARAMHHSYLRGEALVDYLVRSMQRLRSDYSRNTILNIFICLSQGFLTIFSGEPGTGKSSVCRISASILGMNLPAQASDQREGSIRTGRFCSVAVERGWTSRRDLIGFYNSLTQSFDKANRPLFDLLSILDQETRSSLNDTDLPALVLLDDANLSSMEYYWADFMALSDNEKIRGEINLGEDFALQIPDSLHFAATVNTDHTTEPLSPRLLDRAWVVRLPDLRVSLYQPLNLWDIRSELVPYSALQEVFGVSGSQDLYFPEKVDALFEQALVLFKEAGIPVSTRAELAVRGYVHAASRWFEEDAQTKAPAEIVALDYAIAQRLLPQISGSGTRVRKGLEKLDVFFVKNGLNQCAAILEEIIARGDASMQYYQYFA